MSDSHMTLDNFFKTHTTLGPGEVILDVRRPDEYAEAHIKGSINIPVDEVAQKIEELKKYSKIYIHCKRGGRAQTAFQTLSQMGLTNLVCVHDAGMDKWLECGHPVEKL
jgi:phage shock protein E